MVDEKELRAIFVRMYDLLLKMERSAERKNHGEFEVLTKEFGKYFNLAAESVTENTNTSDNPLLNQFDLARNNFTWAFQDTTLDVEELRKKGRLGLIGLYKKYSIDSLAEGKKLMIELEQTLKNRFFSSPIRRLIFNARIFPKKIRR